MENIDYNIGMEDLREVISKNIITLRKQKGMTQLDLAKKINYSDKAVSRWEKGEVLPDIETLQSLSKIFGVPLSYMIESHQETELVKRKPTRNELIVQALAICIIWLFIVVFFVYINLIYEYSFWQAFVWGVPASALLTLWSNKKWGNNTLKVVLQSIFVWSLITSFYLTFLEQNLWLIYIIGIPIQACIIFSIFMKPNLKDF